MARSGRPRLSLKARALQLLAQREHSRLELRRKLLRHAAVEARDEVGNAAVHAPDFSPAAGEDPAQQRRAAGKRAVVGRSVPDPPLFTLSSASRTEPAATEQQPVRSGRAASSSRREFGRAGRPSPGVEASVDALLDWLEANAFLSEERFVESRVRARAARLGTLRIRHELAQHGVELPAGTAQELRAGEAERAASIWQRKFGTPAADAAGRARQMRFLAARGFDSEVVRRVVPAPRRAGTPEMSDDAPDDE